VTAPRHDDGLAATAEGREAALRAWLLEVETQLSAAAPPRGVRRRLTMPVRAARRFRSLVTEVGPSQAVLLAAEYAGRRLGWRP
jgi:hypothetical protein